MSADGNKKGLLWSIENGASDYLTKPLDVTILAEKCLKNFT